MKLKEFIEINPKIKIEKNLHYPFIEMKNIIPYKKIVKTIKKKKFSGSGSRFLSGDTLLARITPCLENGNQHGVLLNLLF